MFSRIGDKCKGKGTGGQAWTLGKLCRAVCFPFPYRFLTDFVPADESHKGNKGNEEAVIAPTHHMWDFVKGDSY